MLRQSVYSRLAGYENLSDTQRHSEDPTFRLIGSEKICKDIRNSRKIAAIRHGVKPLLAAPALELGP
ncbi:MAG: hypothetical protein ABSE93_05045 [Terriglobia bacterium]